MDIKMLNKKMKILQRLDRKHNLFGAGSHRYRLNRKLSEKDLLDYEKQYALAIPEEYREFLAKLGDGGFGPFYGLLPLRNNDKMLQCGSSSDDRGIGKNFLLTRENPLKLDEDEELITLGEARNKFYEDGLFNEEEKADQAYSMRENFLYERATQGIKFLCHEGCAMYNVLVMKGIEAGTVWQLDFSGGAAWGCGILPLVNPLSGQSLHFFNWYNIWLDRAIKSLRNNEKDVWGYVEYTVV